jgi:hypothetical protein
MKFLPLSALIALSVASAACAAKPPTVEQKQFTFRISGDPGKPVANAELMVNGQTLATSDAQGVARLALSGHEGDTFEVSVRCPADFQSPARTTKVAIHRLADDKVTEYDATCLPKTRTVVLAVNGMKGYRLPVVELGKTIGETDDSGAATILLHVEPNDQFEVTLDTSAPENAQLRPRNPAATFVSKNEDEVLVFDPQLSLQPKPRATMSRRHVPVKIDPMIPIRIQ